MNKSSVEEIRARFDADVERFSNLETGQSATIDAPYVLELIAEAAAQVTPNAESVLDVGCGAGNYTLRLLARLPGLHCSLLDLSQPMLERAVERVSTQTTGRVTAMQGDVREVDLGEGTQDVILAAAVLHHLRDEADWRETFAKLFRCLRPGGSIWISDLVSHDTPAVHAMMWTRYGEYLAGLRDEAYRDHVFRYIEVEDTPRSVGFQMRLLHDAGFEQVDILHKNGPFAAFGAVRP